MQEGVKIQLGFPSPLSSVCPIEATTLSCVSLHNTHTHTTAATVRACSPDSEPSEGRASLFASGVLTTRTVWLPAEVQQPIAKSQLLAGKRRGREGGQILSEITWCLAL